MKENEKLDLILEEIQKMRNDLREAIQKLDKFEAGQSRLQREIYKVDRKITDTYNLALDTWGQSVENGAWLESRHTTWLEGGMLQN